MLYKKWILSFKFFWLTSHKVQYTRDLCTTHFWKKQTHWRTHHSSSADCQLNMSLGSMRSRLCGRAYHQDRSHAVEWILHQPDVSLTASCKTSALSRATRLAHTTAVDNIFNHLMTLTKITHLTCLNRISSSKCLDLK